MSNIIDLEMYLTNKRKELNNSALEQALMHYLRYKILKENMEEKEKELD